MQKILVVDDSRTIRVRVQKILAAAGYEVITAENGQQALTLMDDAPDLMVLDVVMPVMDGFAVCKKLEEAGERLEKLPIVFLTSVDSHAMTLLGEQYGAYLQKPVQETEFLQAVKSQLESTAA